MILERIIRKVLSEQTEPSEKIKREFEKLKKKSTSSQGLTSKETDRFVQLTNAYPALRATDIPAMNTTATTKNLPDTYKSEKHVVFNNDKTLNDAIAALKTWDPSANVKENLKAFSVRIKYKGGTISDATTLRILAGLIQNANVSTTMGWVYFCSEDLKTKDQKQLFNIWGFGPDWTTAHDAKGITDKITMRGSVGAGAKLVKWSDAQSVINATPDIKELFKDAELQAFSKLSDLTNTQLVSNSLTKSETEPNPVGSDATVNSTQTTSGNVDQPVTNLGDTNNTGETTKQTVPSAQTTISNDNTVTKNDVKPEPEVKTIFEKNKTYKLNVARNTVIQLYKYDATNKKIVQTKGYRTDAKKTERVQFIQLSKDKQYALVKLLDSGSTTNYWILARQIK